MAYDIFGGGGGGGGGGTIDGIARATISAHTLDTNNPHAVTKSQVGLGSVANVDTSTTANITDSADKRFISDAQKAVLENTSGINTGDESNATIKTKLGSASTTTDGYLTKEDFIIFNDKANTEDFAPISHITDNTNPHSVTKAQVGLENVVNVDTSTTANIVDSENKRFVTDTDLTTLSNTSGTNTGDETNTTIISKIGYTPENTLNKGVNNGYCGLDSGGKIPLQNLPSTLLKYIGTWNAETNIPNLTATDLTKVSHVYVVSHDGTQFGITWKAGDWLIYDADGVAEKSDNSDNVVSVNGKTGVVVIDKADVGLNNVDNTSDLDKPISTLTQTALNLKADNLDLTAHTTNTSNPHGVTKAQVGLANVANIDTTTTTNITDSADKRFVSDAAKDKLTATTKTIISEITDTIETLNWSATTPFTQDITLSVAGHTITDADYDINIYRVSNSVESTDKLEIEAYSYIDKAVISADNTLTLTAYDYKPLTDINVKIEVIKKW
jgi:hypothetical protein